MSAATVTVTVSAERKGAIKMPKEPGQNRRVIREGNLPHTGDGKTQASRKIPASEIQMRHRTDGRDSRIRKSGDIPHDGRHRK